MFLLRPYLFPFVPHLFHLFFVAYLLYLLPICCEWLSWHLGQGVQHFYIYDHSSKQPVSAFVRSLGPTIYNTVTVIDWSGSHENAQPDAYNDCLSRFGAESKWIGFIDADEYVRVKTGQTLPEFLTEKKFSGYGATTGD